jgi:hypothetical protein
MPHWYHLTAKSSNAKTGPIAVSTTSQDSCPSDCPLMSSGCYAKSGPLKLHWDKVSAGPWIDKPRGTDLMSFCDSLRQLPGGSLFRHNQAGDLPHKDGTIDHISLTLIAKACHSQRLTAWTYTHHDVSNSHNLDSIAVSIGLGLTVNVSAHSQQHAAACHKQGLPSVCIVPRGETRKNWEHDGVKFLVCPAQTSEKTCSECKLCAIANRSCVVAFKAHGTQAKKVEATIL